MSLNSIVLENWKSFWNGFSNHENLSITKSNLSLTTGINLSFYFSASEAIPRVTSACPDKTNETASISE